MLDFREIELKDLKEIYDRLSALQGVLTRINQNYGNITKLYDNDKYSIVTQYDNGGIILELKTYCSLTVHVAILDYKILRIAIFAPNYSVAMECGTFIKLDYDKFCQRVSIRIKNEIKKLNSQWNKTKNKIEMLECKSNAIMGEMEELKSMCIL